MKQYKRYILPTILLTSSLTINAKEPLIKTQYSYASGGEDLRSFLENQVGVPQNVLDESGYFQKIQNWNPGIENTSQLEPGERVYIEVPYNTVLTPPIDMNRSMASNTTASNSSQSDLKAKKKKSGVSLFYTLSSGTFEEGLESEALTTTSSQDSPITLGLSLNKPINENWDFSGSIYFSKLDDGLSDTDETVTIPLEYGITSYFERNFSSLPFLLYGGIDHERFSSFNTDELVLGEDLDVRTHVLTFATFGVSKSFSIFDKNLLVKLSYSSSVASQQSRESLENPDPFTGSKFISYFNLRASESWSYHAFYKQHDLIGATDLQIARIGLGVGYQF